MTRLCPSFGITAFIMSCTMGLMAGGCAIEDPSSIDEAAPPVSAPLEQDLDHKTDPTIELGPTYTETALSAHGGGGGNYTGHVTPPAIIYGVHVRSGGYVDSIRFAWYQPSRSDNLFQSGDPYGSTPAYGGTGGIDRGWWYCPNGKGVIGIRGSASRLVDRIGVICGDVAYPDPNSPSNTYSPLWGGGGGFWFNDDKCPPARIVDSFNVRSGGYLDNLQAICINAR